MKKFALLVIGLAFCNPLPAIASNEVPANMKSPFANGIGLIEPYDYPQSLDKKDIRSYEANSLRKDFCFLWAVNNYKPNTANQLLCERQKLSESYQLVRAKRIAAGDAFPDGLSEADSLDIRNAIILNKYRDALIDSGCLPSNCAVYPNIITIDE